MNRYYPHTIIAQEGWSFILGGLAASVFFSFLCGWWSLPFWIFTLFCVNFFRDPARNIPEAPDAVISPADGRVVVVERALDPYRNTEALKISVFMNVFNVHSQRSPVSGVVTDVQYTAGKFLNASLDKSSTENERNAVLMTTRTGREVTFVQVAGLIARRVLCYTNKGDTMVRGERYGFIRFGSRVDVYLPLDATANVAIGDKVRASETILAFLPLEPSEPKSEFNKPNSSQEVAETRLKADLQPIAETHFQAAPIQAETVAQFSTSPISSATPISLDEARLAVETAKLKAEAEAAKQAAEHAKAQAEAEIANLKAQAEQARVQAEQAKAQAEAEVARLKAEQEAAQLKAKQEAEAKAKAEQEAAQLRAQQEAEARAKAEQEAAQLKAQQEAEAKAKAEQEAAQLRAQQEAEARAKAEQEAAQLKAKQEAEAKAKAEQEAAQLRAQQEAEARAKAEQEAAQLKAQQEAEAKAKAEQEAQAQAAAARARAEEVAKAQAAEKAKQEALAKAQAEAEAKLKAEQAAKAKAAQAAKEQARAEQNAKAKAEAEALAEIAARKPIVRREVFAAVPEPWQTIEPREVIIRTEVVDKK